MNKSNIIKKGREVLNTEAGAIKKLSKDLDQNFIKAVNLIIKLEGKLILSGVGKSGNIASKLASSFTSTGVPSIYLNPVDASHGDMGIISQGDILIILSNSGESYELSDLINFAKKKKIRIISTAPLLAQAMLNISHESSVSSLFSEKSLKPIYEGIYPN